MIHFFLFDAYKVIVFGAGRNPGRKNSAKKTSTFAHDDRKRTFLKENRKEGTIRILATQFVFTDE